jgi:hypothetical protein
MRHVLRPAIPVNSLVMVTLFVTGLVLGWDESVPLTSGARLFFLILAPLAVYHLDRIAASLKFFEVTPEGVAVQNLFRRQSIPYRDIEHLRFSRFTGDFLVESRSARLAIPGTTEHFGELHGAILTGVWAHQGPGDYELVVDKQMHPEPEDTCTLKPSLSERVHAVYAVTAPLVWAIALGWTAGPARFDMLPLLLVAGGLQAAMNLRGMRHLLNWYELRADGLVIHSLWRERFLPASDFLTSLVREDGQGRCLELAFSNRSVRIRFGFRMPLEELAGMLDQRWTAPAPTGSASY